MLAGACAGWLAVAVGHIFSFDLGWNGIHANLKGRVSHGASFVLMQAGLGMVFGLIAAAILGTAHAVLLRRVRWREVIAWGLIGLSGGVVCWVSVASIDTATLAASGRTLDAAEQVVWMLVWGLLGGIVGAQVGARSPPRGATARPAP